MVPRQRGSKTVASENRAPLQVSPDRGALDAAAFEDMVLTYAQPLTTFAWRYVQSEDVAVDLVQDVFANVWEHRAELRVRGNLRAYLLAATRNRALNALAHGQIEARWRERVMGGEPERSMPAASERVEQTELSAAIAEALRSLSPRAREIARMRWIDRLSRREIAEVLGIALPTVSVHLTRTVKRLRGLLRRFAP